VHVKWFKTGICSWEYKGIFIPKPELDVIQFSYMTGRGCDIALFTCLLDISLNLRSGISSTRRQRIFKNHRKIRPTLYNNNNNNNNNKMPIYKVQ